MLTEDTITVRTPKGEVDLDHSLILEVQAKLREAMHTYRDCGWVRQVSLLFALHALAEDERVAWALFFYLTREALFLTPYKDPSGEGRLYLSDEEWRPNETAPKYRRKPKTEPSDPRPERPLGERVDEYLMEHALGESNAVSVRQVRRNVVGRSKDIGETMRDRLGWLLLQREDGRYYVPEKD